MQLYPRLSLPHARTILAARPVESPERLRQAPLPVLDGAHFAPTGGNRVPLAALLEIRRTVDAILDDVGFPATSLPARQRFDRDLIVYFSRLALPTVEMLRAEVWAWIAVRLAPHAVAWRFQGRDGIVAIERFAGSIHRNALGRLWLRSWVLNDDREDSRHALATAVTEDAAVALLERVSLAADHRLARTIVRCWLGWQRSATPDLEGLLRGAMKRIRIAVMFSEPLGMSDAALAGLVEAAFVREQREREISRGVPVQTAPNGGDEVA